MDARRDEPSVSSGRSAGRTPSHFIENARRAYREFLRTPSIVVGAFLLLAAATFWLDHASAAPDSGGSRSVAAILFANSEATTDFLTTIATSMITATSITFSLLLLAVQQAAGELTSVVLDQFLRRESNRFYFGFFVGLSLYALIILATVSPSFNPVIGATAALALTAAALFMLILIIYTTVDEMRAVSIVEAIRDFTLSARKKQLSLLQGTRREPRAVREGAVVRSDGSGFLVAIDVGALERAAAEANGAGEIAILPSIGDFVSFKDPVARVSAARPSDLDAAVLKALRLEDERDLDRDPALGLVQLSTIAWTSISTSKQNPNPGLLVCNALRDILARWSDDPGFARDRVELEIPQSRVVYGDRVPEQIMDALESLGVVASESMQHQVSAELFETLASLFGRLPPRLQDRAEDIVLRALSGLGDHVPTRKIEAALAAAAGALAEAGRRKSAAAVRDAREELAKSIGKLNSRATRTPKAA